MKVHRWKMMTTLAAAASLTLALGAAPSQAGTFADSANDVAGLSASDLSKLPLTNRHRTRRERANLAVVLRAYHDGEGNVLDAQDFMDLFADDGVLNGIGGVEGQTTLRGQQLGDLILYLGGFLPDIHRELKEISVSGDVVSIELSIQGTFSVPFQTPVGAVKPTGAKIDFPTADFWYLHNGKVEKFDCHISFTTLFAQLGVLPDYASAVGASMPTGN